MMMMMMLTSDNIGCHGEDDAARGSLCVRFELLHEGFENYQQNSLWRFRTHFPPPNLAGYRHMYLFVRSFVRLFVITILVGKKGQILRIKQEAQNFLTW